MSQPPVKAKRRMANVHLTKLSPHMQKLIKKPLLKRSKELYKPPGVEPNDGSNPTSAGGIVPIDEENAQAAEMLQQIRNLKPTLELVETKDNSDKGSKDRSANDDSRFSTTFGFSHGVDVAG